MEGPAGDKTWKPRARSTAPATVSPTRTRRSCGEEGTHSAAVMTTSVARSTPAQRALRPATSRTTTAGSSPWSGTPTNAWAMSALGTTTDEAVAAEPPRQYTRREGDREAKAHIKSQPMQTWVMMCMPRERMDEKGHKRRPERWPGRRIGLSYDVQCARYDGRSQRGRMAPRIAMATAPRRGMLLRFSTETRNRLSRNGTKKMATTIAKPTPMRRAGPRRPRLSIVRHSLRRARTRRGRGRPAPRNLDHHRGSRHRHRAATPPEPRPALLEPRRYVRPAPLQWRKRSP